MSERKKAAEIAKQARRRECEACGKEFYPRQYQLDTGQGRFCSMACAHKNLVKVAHSPEANQRRAKSRLAAVQEGRLKYKSGPDHPQWKGGRTVSYETSKERRAESLKRYRAANPHKTREWLQNRRRRKFGRLPAGYVAQLFGHQRGKCAVCKKKLGDSYHVDHIEPVSRGGKHEPGNIQLLCAACNVRKSAKDPVAFMQERGFLL